MDSDPIWSSHWEDIAKTYIDEDVFDDTRQFNWRAYCDALTNATIFDPSGAQNHWNCWVRKAEELKQYQYFDLAVDLLEYGIEKTSQMKTKEATEARGNFEFELGKVFCAMMSWEAAVLSLEDSIRHMPDAGRRHYKALGDAYMSCGRYEEALAVFNKLLDEDPSSSGDHASVASIYLFSGNPSRALKEYTTAIHLQEKFAVERAGCPGYPTAFDQYVRDWYIDLGMAYERLSREKHALKCFQKALPHAEDQAGKEIVRHGEELAFEGQFLRRTTGRALMKLGWLYERLDLSDKRAEVSYEKAVWVFQKTVHAEDDFLEETECMEAEEALARIKLGEPWVFPGEEADRELRNRARARTYRTNWGVNLERRKSGTKQSRMRGH